MRSIAITLVFLPLMCLAATKEGLYKFKDQAHAEIRCSSDQCSFSLDASNSGATRIYSDEATFERNAKRVTTACMIYTFSPNGSFNAEAKADADNLVLINEDCNPEQTAVAEGDYKFSSLYRASFDCAQARSSVESAICSHKQLASLDIELSKRYQDETRNISVEDSAVLKADQKNWMRKRNACSDDISCLEKAYRDRLEALKSPVAKKASVTESVYLGTWRKSKTEKLVISKADPKFIGAKYKYDFDDCVGLECTGECCEYGELRDLSSPVARSLDPTTDDNGATVIREAIFRLSSDNKKIEVTTKLGGKIQKECSGSYFRQ